MSDWWKEADPEFAKEQRKYEHPVPSRVLIIQHLEQRGAPAQHNVLCRELEVQDVDAVEALRRRLLAMVRDGQLLQTRKGAFGLLDKMDLVAGRVQGNREGYGFLIPDDGSDDLFLSTKQMRQLFDGDRAAARVDRIDRKGRREGVIVEVLERNTQQLVGRFQQESGASFIVPENARISRELMVKPGPLLPSAGQYVLAEIVEQPGRHRPAVAIVKEILGDHMAPGMEIDVAIHSYGIPNEWPDEVKQLSKTFSPEVAEKDKKGRVDLRHLPLVTIDGEDARDFDDAVYCETKRSGGWRLFVAIADVSHYVTVDSKLDEEAQRRGNSVYFPGHVVPMLPEVLSNGLCSLNPKVDRLAMVCEMTISSQGRLSGYSFYEAVIQSHARLTYTEVSAMLEHPKTDEGKSSRKQYKELLPALTELYQLYQSLRKARTRRGAIDFETTETRIVFGDARKIDHITPTERNEAHRLIEECMLCANVSSARFLQKNKIAGLYRVHEGPNPQKLLNLQQYLGEMGLALPGKAKPTPGDYQHLLGSVRERPDFHVIQTMMLRSMTQAVYSPENEGHFGLGFPAYTHFTSPIRRYPDLLVHRAIRQVIRCRADSDFMQVKEVRRVDGARYLAKKNIYPYDIARMVAFGEQCSVTERRADEATRDVTNWLKCEYMQQHLGETHEGVVSGVTGFGLFVELKNIYVEGLIHISSLPGDYYHFDPARQRLQGERTGTIFGLGDEVKVVVTRVDLDDRKIDFELAGSVRVGRRRSSKNQDEANRTRAKKRKPRRGKAKGVESRQEVSPELEFAQFSDDANTPRKKGRAKRKGGGQAEGAPVTKDQLMAEIRQLGAGKPKKRKGKKVEAKKAKKGGSKAKAKKAPAAVTPTGRTPRKRKAKSPAKAK